jgi:hypothetical protein
MVANVAPTLNSAQRSRLRTLVTQARDGVNAVLIAIQAIHDEELWIEHGSFKKCIEQELGISRSRAYQLLQQARVNNTLALPSPNGRSHHSNGDVEAPTRVDTQTSPSEGQLPERHTRILATLPAEQRAEALEGAREVAAASGKPVTAAIIREVVREMRSQYTCPNCGGHEQDEDGDCLACREPAREPETTADPPEVDDSPEAQRKAKNAEIEAFCRGLKAYIDENMPEDPWITQNGRGEQAKQKVTNACETLRSCKCSALCPRCNGEGCPRCLDTGRVTRYVLEQMS